MCTLFSFASILMLINSIFPLKDVHSKLILADTVRLGCVTGVRLRLRKAIRENACRGGNMKEAFLEQPGQIRVCAFLSFSSPVFAPGVNVICLLASWKRTNGLLLYLETGIYSALLPSILPGTMMSCERQTNTRLNVYWYDIDFR